LSVFYSELLPARRTPHWSVEHQNWSQELISKNSIWRPISAAV